MPEINNFREYFDGLTDKSKYESLPPDRPKSLKEMYYKCVDMVDKDIIVDRKKQFGNSFPAIASLWSQFLEEYYGVKIEINPAVVSYMMALMKVSRLLNSPDHKDSQIDLVNYLHIAFNYDEYENS